jgi:hypothetical protein
LQDPPKFSQIWIFGLKTNHLATLSLRVRSVNFKQWLMSGSGKIYLSMYVNIFIPQIGTIV